MKNGMLRFISLLLIFLLLPLFSLGVFAEEESSSSPPSLDAAELFVLYNLENDRMIMQKNLDVEVSPSSTVKLMSGLLICEALGDRVDEKVTLTAEMLRGGSGKPLGLAVGQTLSIRSLMLAAFSGGYSDAITALSVLGFGSSANLIDRMNERAATLGMTSTVYKNITGFDTYGQKTTLRDSLKVAVAASKNELFMTVSSDYNTKIEFADGSWCFSYGSNELLNKNSQFFCRSVRGMNSGLTDSGACIATFGKHNGASFILIAMGCPHGDARFELAQNVLDYVYNNYGYRTLLSSGSVVGEIEVKMAAMEIEKVNLVLLEDLQVFAGEHEELSALQYSLLLPHDGLTAPISSNDTVAYYTVWNGTTQLASARVTVGRAVERNDFLVLMDGVKSYLGGRAFKATLVSLGVMLVLSFILPSVALASRQRKRRYVRQRGGFKLK